MAIRRFVIPVTVDEYGDAEAYSPVLSGELVSIRLVVPGSGGFGEYTDVTITAENTGETLWAESDVSGSVTRHPRAATHTTAGAASNYDGSSHAVLAKAALATDRVKIVVAEAGDGAAGTFHVTVDD